MAFNLGDIFVTIRARTDQLESGLQKLGVLGSEAGNKMGVVGRAFSAAESSSKALGTGITAIGAAFTAAIGTMVIGGGFSRALNIQDAEAKLKGLGYSLGDIKTITASTLEAVQGTAFSLDQAMTVAASAMAAGIAPGKELTKYIQGVADAATIAGTDMNDMGYIFNKVQATGKVTGETLAMLSDRGIPVLQWLAKSYGVTAEKMTEMVSSGQVDADRFRQIMEQNIGGAAKASGETVRGAWENMKAAMARVGANIVTQYLPVIQDSLSKITKWFDDNKKAITDAAGEVVKWFGKIVDALGKLKDNKEALAALAGAITGALVPAFVALAVAVWSALSPLLPFIAIGAAIGLLVQYLVEKMGGWGKVWEAVKKGAQELVDLFNQYFKPSLDALWNTIKDSLLPALQDLWKLIERLKPVWEAIGIILGAVIVIAIWLVINAINILIKVISGIIDVVTKSWNAVLDALKAIGDAFTAVKDAIVKVFDDISKKVDEVITWIRDNIIKPFVDVVSAYFNALWAVWSYVFEMILAIAKAVWDEIWNRVIKPVLDAISAGFSWLWNNVIKPVWDAISGAAGAVGKAIGDAFSNAWNWVTNVWNQAVGFFQNIWNKVTDAAKSIGSTISNAVGSAFGAVSGVVKSAINSAIDLVNSAISKVNSVAAKIHGPQIGYIPKLFKGVRNFTGGLAIVGENGPELVDLNRGADVMTNNESRQWMEKGGGNSGPQIVVNVTGPITSPHVADDYAVAIGDGIIRRLQQNVRI